MVMNPQVGLRQYFESNGMKVNYDPTSQNINVLNPTTNASKTFSPGGYTNTNGTAQIGLSDAQNAFKQPIQQPQFNYKDALSNYMNTINSNNFSNAWSQAQQQANYQANQQKSGYQNQLNLLSSNRDNSLAGVNTSLTNAKQDLQDRTFQNYLASRQAVANGGLSGTGLANDADTRVQLANNRSLAQLENNAAQQTNAINNTYNTQSQGVMNDMNQINPAMIAQGLYEKYRQNDLQEQAQKAQQLYNAMNFGAQQDQNAWNRDRTENADAWNRYQDALKSDEWNKTFGLQQNQQDWNKQVQEAGLTGMYNGQPTLAKEQADAMAQYRNMMAQFELARANALDNGVTGRVSVGSGGGRSSSGGVSAKAPTKANMQSSLEDYFYNRYGDPSNRPTIDDIEQGLRDNAGQLRDMGYDVNNAVDAAYKVYSQGQFPTKKAYDDYVAKLTKQREQYYKNNPPE